MSIGQNIKLARKSKGISQKNLAEMLGISTAYLCQLEGGQRNLDVSLLKRIASSLNVTEFDLMAENVSSFDMPARKVPIISWVRAGAWHEPNNIYQPGDADEWIYTNATKDQSAYALRVVGDSMEPEFYEGDIIIVSPYTRVESGDYAIVQYQGDVSLKQVKYDNDHISIIPVNRKYPILTFRSEHAKDVRIIGRVVEQYKKR